MFCDGVGNFWRSLHDLSRRDQEGLRDIAGLSLNNMQSSAEGSSISNPKRGTFSGRQKTIPLFRSPYVPYTLERHESPFQTTLTSPWISPGFGLSTDEQAELPLPAGGCFSFPTDRLPTGFTPFVKPLRMLLMVVYTATLGDATTGGWGVGVVGGRKCCWPSTSRRRRMSKPPRDRRPPRADTARHIAAFQGRRAARPGPRWCGGKPGGWGRRALSRRGHGRGHGTRRVGPSVEIVLQAESCESK